MRASPLTLVRCCRLAGEPPPRLTESQFRAAVVELARERGWKVWFVRPVRIQRAGGAVYHETPVGGDGVGVPDLELVRDRLLKRELKVYDNGPTPEQREWLTRYERAGVDAGVWTWPDDWDRIQEELK